jgi:hypothetical protein
MRTFTVCFYLVKAAERDVIRRTALKLLCGLPLTTVYTPHFAMCTDTLSEILLATGSEQVETKSVMRFSSSGLVPKGELKAIRERMDEAGRHHPETVGLWNTLEADYFDLAAAKATQGLQKTIKEISRNDGTSFNVMIINNDTLPLFELLVPREYNHLEIARPGDVTQFRYEVALCSGKIMGWKMVHAYRYR